MARSCYLGENPGKLFGHIDHDVVAVWNFEEPPGRLSGQKADPEHRYVPASAVAQPIHQHLVLSAVDLDHGAVDEEGKIRRKIGDEIGDLLAFGDAAERDA